MTASLINSSVNNFQLSPADSPSPQSHALPEVLHLEASALESRLTEARSVGALDLLDDVDSDIGAFVCHLAREVAGGEIEMATLDFYNDRFTALKS
jgi:hypothetical protein